MRDQNPPVQQRYDVPDMLRLSKKLHNERIIACCVTCKNFDHKLEVCRLVMMRPPAEVIAYGCPKWDDERIPF